MTMTVKAAAATLTDLMYNGFADARLVINGLTSVDSIDFDGIEVVITGSASGPVLPAPIERDDAGLFQHPQHPYHVNGPEELADWFRAQGLTYTLNFLIGPEYENEADRLPAGDFSDWELRVPRGNGWFLWSIDEGSDGEPIALWVAPLEQ